MYAPLEKTWFDYLPVPVQKAADVISEIITSNLPKLTRGDALPIYRVR